MQPSVLKVASDMKLFEVLGKNEAPKTVDELATATGSDEVLMSEDLPPMSRLLTENDGQG